MLVSEDVEAEQLVGPAAIFAGVGVESFRYHTRVLLQGSRGL
jgi:arginine/ornithine N-succinyltransferase beta subunit